MDSGPSAPEIVSNPTHRQPYNRGSARPQCHGASGIADGLHVATASSRTSSQCTGYRPCPPTRRQSLSRDHIQSVTINPPLDAPCHSHDCATAGRRRSTFGHVLERPRPYQSQWPAWLQRQRQRQRSLRPGGHGSRPARRRHERPLGSLLQGAAGWAESAHEDRHGEPYPAVERDIRLQQARACSRWSSLVRPKSQLQTVMSAFMACRRDFERELLRGSGLVKFQVWDQDILGNDFLGQVCSRCCSSWPAWCHTQAEAHFSMAKCCPFTRAGERLQAEVRLTEVGGAAHTATWLPLYARLGDQIKSDDLGELRVAVWLGPHGEHGRLNRGERSSALCSAASVCCSSSSVHTRSNAVCSDPLLHLQPAALGDEACRPSHTTPDCSQ